jgi:hypothetical protein
LAYAWLWVLEIDFFVKTLKWLGAGCSGDVPKIACLDKNSN